jgi:hypothetical protein
MSEIVGSNVAPEFTLRFSVEDLHAAGVHLGSVESNMHTPKVTFEGLQRRAEDLFSRADERRRRKRTLQRSFALAMVICGGVALFGSLFQLGGPVLPPLDRFDSEDSTSP